MYRTERSKSSGGIGFFGLLGVAFIVLKLCGVIDWPWWVTLSPLWGSIALWLVIVVIVCGVSAWRETH